MSTRVFLIPMILTLATDTAFSPADGSYRATTQARPRPPLPQPMTAKNDPRGDLDITLIDTTFRGAAQLAYNSAAYDRAVEAARANLPPEGYATYEVRYTRGGSGMGMVFDGLHRIPPDAGPQVTAADPKVRPFFGTTPPPPRFVVENTITITPTRVYDGERRFLTPDQARSQQMSFVFRQESRDAARAAQTVRAAERQARSGSPWANATFASPAAEAARQQGVIDSIRDGAQKERQLRSKPR